jgi:hypothetical protein
MSSFQLDFSDSGSSDSEVGLPLAASRMVEEPVGCTPQEAAYYEGTAAMMSQSLTFDGDDPNEAQMRIQAGSDLDHLREQMQPEDDPKVGSYVVVALGSVQQGTREEWKQLQRTAKKKLETAGKKTNAAMVMATNGGFAVFLVTEHGEERGVSWVELKLVGEGAPFGTTSTLRKAHRVSSNNTAFFMVLREGCKMHRQAAKKREEEEKGNNVLMGKCANVHVDDKKCVRCGVYGVVGISSRRRTGEGERTSSTGLVGEASHTSAVNTASHLKESYDNDGVLFPVSKMSLLEERRKEAQIVVRMMDPVRRRELLRDGVVDWDAWYQDWTAPLNTGTHELRQLGSPSGGTTHDYSKVSLVHGCRILKKERFTMAVRGMWLPAMDAGTMAGAATTAARRESFINCDDFIPESETMPDCEGMDLTARNWLDRLSTRMEDFHVSVHGETYCGTFAAVHRHLNGPSKEEYTLSYVAGNLEVGLMAFYKMAAANYAMRWLDSNAATPQEGYHKQMAAQLKATIDRCMSEENLKHQFPHTLFWNRWEGVLGRVGQQYSKKRTSSSAVLEEGDATSTKKKKKTEKMKRKKAAAAGGGGSSGNSGTIPTAGNDAQLGKAAIGANGSPATKATQQFKEDQPCMSHVLFTTGLSKQKCTRGEACRFGHWKKGRISEADIKGDHWIRVLAENPSLRAMVKSQHNKN